MGPPTKSYNKYNYSRLRNFEQQIERSSREYNMEKLTALKTDVDDFSRKFEECQDAYATSMYEFISKEQEYTDKIQQVRWHAIITCTVKGQLYRPWWPFRRVGLLAAWST